MLHLRSLPFLLALAVPAAGQDKIPGLGPVGPVQKLHSGFAFTEGPAADADGNVYFSDIPNERIHKIDLAGKLSVFREKTNHSNGLMFNGKGELVACEMDGQIAAYTADGKARRVVADKYDAKRFNAPNDLVVDQHGGVYFTDPEFRAPMPLPQGLRSVYYAAADGKVTRLFDKDQPNPNGVLLSPDEKTLYVIPSSTARMMAYPVTGPGKLGEGKVFCELEQPKGQKDKGGDGVALDAKGNLYITSGLGLQVFDPAGKKLGVIAFPEQPANAKFGGKAFKTLYVTARTSVYAVEMEVAGHRFPGKK